jgi:ribosomal protein L11 methyltransferase
MDDRAFRRPTYVMRLSADEVSAKRVAHLFAETCDSEAVAVSAFESEKGWSVEVHFANDPDRAAVRDLLRAISPDAAAVAVFETVAQNDWVSASLAGLKPVHIGRLVVHGAHDRAKVRVNQVGIEIEAALAFGTGHHGTTQGCLAAIDRLAHRRHPKSILDLGTGTGVLAIAAARLMRHMVIAGDVDPISVVTSRANARVNCVGNLVRVTRAAGVNSPLIRAHAPYDFVIANILLLTLKQLARPTGLLLSPGAIVVLSGLLNSQANAALAVWQAQGLTLIHRKTIEGWTTITLIRREK